MGNEAKSLYQKGAAILKEAGIESYDYDCRTLLEWICNISRMDLLLDPQLQVSDTLAEEFELYIERRAAHEPLQYLIGEWDFMGLSFLVNPSVLIPRQDTEVLVEWILDDEERNHSVDVLDVCTGSGCIAISLDVLHRDCGSKNWLVEALDISPNALQTARENGVRNQSRVVFRESNMFEQIHKTYDIIVSNPPYIPTDVVDGLMAEVVKHEPRLALDGREDGLYFYRILAREGKKHLKSGGRLYLEIGHDQGESVPEILEAEGFISIQVRKDLAGLDRCVKAVFPGE